jgi:microcystin-dependent protein
MFYPGFLELPPKATNLTNYRALRAPTQYDDVDASYGIGSIWVYASAVYLCVDNSLNNAVWKQIAVLPVSVMPVGFTTVWWTSTAPSLWLLCHGQSLLRASYVDLFAVLGTVWGAADGSHFSLPDLRGLLARCAGTPPYDSTIGLGSAGGRDVHAITTNELPSHLHGAGTLFADMGVGTLGTVNTRAPKGVTGVTSATQVISGNTANLGGGANMDLTNPYLGCEYIIYAGV